MPIHIESMYEKEDADRLLAWFVTGFNDCDLLGASDDKKYLIMQKRLNNTIDGNTFGRVVYNLFVDEEANNLEIKDIDVVLDNPNFSQLTFAEKLEQSSESNEYYEVITENHGLRASIETVNHQLVSSELLGTTQNVHISIFPFNIKIFDTMENLSAEFGLDKEVNVGDEKYKISGLADYFVASWNKFESTDEDPFSYVIGNVVGVKDVSIQADNEVISFAIVTCDTEFGQVPVAMNRKSFDLTKLAPGKIVMMDACVKAELDVPLHELNEKKEPEKKLEEKANWKFCAVGNIVRTRVDENGKEWHGTAAYRPGAKVYLAGRFWDSECETIDVIGLTRKNKYQVNNVPVGVIENVRASRVYTPQVLSIMEDFEFYDCWWNNDFSHKKEVKAFIKRWKACENERKQKKVESTTAVDEMNFWQRIIEIFKS